MDYIPVYADEGSGTVPGTVTISPERIQMLGVRTEAASLRTHGAHRARGRHRGGRRAPHRRRQSEIRGLDREAARQHDRPDGPARRSAARGLQPRSGAGATRVSRRPRGGRRHGAGRCHGARQCEGDRRGRALAPQKLGHLGRPARAPAAHRHRHAHADPERADRRHRDGEDRARRPAFRRRRHALPHRRSLDRVAAGRRVRAGPRANPSGPECRQSRCRPIPAAFSTGGSPSFTRP